MNIEIVHRIERILFILIIVSLPFTGIPKNISLFLSGKLSTNVILLLLLVILFEIIKFKAEINKKLLFFGGIYLFWLIISFSHGISTFEYWGVLHNHENYQSEKLYSFLYEYIMNIDRSLFLNVFFVLKIMIKLLVNFISQFGLVYGVWHIYKVNWEKTFFDIRTGCFVLFILMGVYSLVEILWLKLNSNSAENILKYLNPLFFDPVVKSGWWPPLLWENQLRSLCLEPSFFGIISALVMPFLWSYILENGKVVHVIFCSYFSMMIFMTNSRTAALLLLGELLLLTIFFVLKKKFKIVSQRVIIIVCTVVLGFYFNIVSDNISSRLNDGTTTNTISRYLNNNISSAFKEGERSNTTRLNILKAHINFSLEHPVFGSGYELYIPYLEYYIEGNLSRDEELQNFIKDINDQGFMNCSYPIVNQFSFIAMNIGFVGLALFSFPIMYIVINLYKMRKKIFLDDYKIITLIIAFCGTIVAMFSNEAFYSYYIMLGSMYCYICSSKRKIDVFK